MTFYENLNTGGGFLLSISGLIVDDWSGLLDVDILRGENEVIDGMPGEVPVDLMVRAAYDFGVPFNIKGATLPGLYAAIASLRATLSLAPVTLTRRRSKTLTPFYEDHTCNGQFRGLTWTDTSNHLDIGGLLTFRNLDGAWS